VLAFNVLGDTRGGGAGATGNARSISGLVQGVVGVQPKHLGSVVVPERHHEDQSAVEGIAEGLESTLVLEGVLVSEEGLLGITELVADGVEGGERGEATEGVGDDLAVLDPHAADLGERTGGGVVGGQELSDDGEGLVGVKGQSGAEEGLCSCAPGVQIASVLVANAAVSVVTVSTLSSIAARLAIHGAGVRSVGGALRVGFPDVHLRATSSILSGSRIGVVGRRLPVVDVGFSIDKFHVMRALSVAISGAILRSSLVSRIFAQTPIGVHGHEVERAVKTAGEPANVNVKRELLVLEIEHPIGRIVRHEIDARSDVGGVGAVGDELEGEGVSASLDAVGALIVGPVYRTVGRTSSSIRTEGLIPLVPRVTIF